MSTRMCISVPDDLKKRINRARKAVNWSALACEAFERKLGEIAERKARKTMSDVVQRLRASEIAEAPQSHQRGYDDGRIWAQNHATAKQLRRLAESRAAETDWRVGSSAYSNGACFYFIIDPDNSPDRRLGDEFTERYMADGMANDGDYVNGFTEGALDVWEEVRDQL